jgi:hypothetical protein
MEVLSSRLLLSPRDLERSLRFSEQTLGLAVSREWGQGRERGVVFFLGGGLLEVSGSSVGPASGVVRLFLQVRDLRAVRERLRAGFRKKVQIGGGDVGSAPDGAERSQQLAWPSSSTSASTQSSSALRGSSTLVCRPKRARRIDPPTPPAHV